jgi:drug/metabolite transporter (DMT)-like permease
MKLAGTSLAAFLLSVVSGIAYGFAGTILKKAAGNFSLEGGVLAVLGRLVTQKYLLISLFFSGVGYGLYFLIIRKSEIITTTLIIQAVLFLATMGFAALLFKEAITFTKVLAFLLIMAGIAVLLAGK